MKILNEDEIFYKFGIYRIQYQKINGYNESKLVYINKYITVNELYTYIRENFDSFLLFNKNRIR